MRVLLCSPKYFDVTESDPQNKHMDPNDRPNLKLAIQQHDRLVGLYDHLGLEVYLISPAPNLVDMTFAANLGVIVGNKAVLSNFTPLRRRLETDYYGPCLASLGYQIFRLPEGLFFEGAGDAILYKGKILCGYGFRTSHSALKLVERLLETEVVPLKLKLPGRGKRILYHLDTAGIFMEEAGKIILCREALTRDALRRLEKLADIIPADFRDADNLALNAVVIPKSEIRFDKRSLKDDSVKNLKAALAFWPRIKGAVITSSLASKGLRRQIEECGYFPIFIDLDQFLKAGGGAFCLTKIL
jgi:N-dimethylarginine dimethylaminohydrolase